MSLVSCAQCRAELSDDVSVCPHCGFPGQQPSENDTQRRPFLRRVFAGLVKAVLGVMAAIIGVALSIGLADRFTHKEQEQMRQLEKVTREAVKKEQNKIIEQTLKRNFKQQPQVDARILRDVRQRIERKLRQLEQQPPTDETRRKQKKLRNLLQKLKQSQPGNPPRDSD